MTFGVVWGAWHIYCHVVCVLLIVLKAMNIMSWPRRSVWLMLFKSYKQNNDNAETHEIIVELSYKLMEVFACEQLECGLWGWHLLQSCGWWLPTLEERVVCSFSVMSPSMRLYCVITQKSTIRIVNYFINL